jgi:microcystin-dependent protein
MPFAGSGALSGWLYCLGQATNRTTYSALFAVIGTTYGAGDGSTTFNLPDLRGRVPAGLDVTSGGFADRITVTASDVSGTVLGSTGGSQTHTLTAGEIPTSATYRNFTSIGGQGGTSSSGLAQSVSISALTGANDEPHLNLQPTIILNYIIKIN